jgi:hypothetical protein
VPFWHLRIVIINGLLNEALNTVDNILNSWIYLDLMLLLLYYVPGD